MSEPFLGQIQTFGFNFPPRGWAKCDGQLLPIGNNQALFALLGMEAMGERLLRCQISAGVFRCTSEMDLD
jgi:microcystin-dependent protein